MSRLADYWRGFSRMERDARLWVAAWALYHSVGFYPIAPYPENESPPEFQCYWLYMEKRLVP